MSSNNNALKYSTLSYECYGLFGRMLWSLIPAYLWALLSLIIVGAALVVLVPALGIVVEEPVAVGHGDAVLIIIAMLLEMFLSAYFFIVMLAQGYGVMQSDKGLIKGAWGHAKRIYIKVLSAGFIKYLAMLLPAAVPAILVGFVNYKLGMLVGIVLFVILGRYLMGRWEYVVPLVVVKKSRIISAFRESSELVKGHRRLVSKVSQQVILGPVVGFMALGFLAITLIAPDTMVMSGVNSIIGVAGCVIILTLHVCFIFVTMKALEQAKQAAILSAV